MSKEKEERVECITQSTLIKERGWSKKLVEKYLPEPILKTNPHYKCAPPMKLYVLSDVVKIESNEEFIKEFNDYKVKHTKRQESAKKAVNTKLEKLQTEVDSKIEKIRIRVVDDSTLYNETLIAKRQWYEFRGEYMFDYNIDEQTMNRWIVNYIRHELTDYDYDLFQMSGKCGVHKEYYRYRNAVLDKIAEAYPKYRAECNRQKCTIQEDYNG